MIVSDLERSTTRQSREYGLGPFWIEYSEFEAKVQGRATRFGLGVAFAWLGNTLLELVQPLDERSPHARALAEQGEGLHHLAYFVDSIVGQFADGGSPLWLIDATRTPDRHPWGYLAPDEDGLILELIERTPASEEFFENVLLTLKGA